MVARGGKQRIPRPPGTRRGRPAPWAGLDPTALRLDLEHVRTTLREPPEPAGVLIDVPGARDAAVLVAMFEAAGVANVVLTKRPETMPSHQGEIAFPGGKREPEDPTLADAALREAQEEVGLDPTTVEIVAELDRIATVASAFTITPFVGLLDVEPSLVPDPREVVDAFVVPVTELLHPDAYHEETWDLFGAPRPMAFFELPGETVWGATARILTRLLTLLTDSARGPEWDGNRPLG
ncbi:MAG: NUDIX hydrolase [Acidimicrobiia bacterium]